MSRRSTQTGGQAASGPGVLTQAVIGDSTLAISADELARRLRVSLRHVRRLDSSGKLPKPIQLGHSVRWSVAEVEAWLAAGAPDRVTWEIMKGQIR